MADTWAQLISRIRDGSDFYGTPGSGDDDKVITYDYANDRFQLETPSAASSAIEPVSYVLYTDGTDVFIRDRTGALITSAGIVFGLTADSNGRDTEWCSGLVIYNSNNNVINCGAFFDREASPTQEWGVHLTGTSTGNKTIYGSYSGNAGSAYYNESSGSNTHVT